MRIRKLDRRFAAIMLGLFLVLAGLSSGELAITFLLVIVGLFLLARQFSTTRTSPDFRRDQPEKEEAVITDQPRADQVYAHALDSVRRAGLDPADSQVLPVDIGLIAFNRNHDPIIYRTRPVLDDVSSVQPFVQLRLTTRARGRIRFEISDARGKILFVHEEDHEFERGRNLISPAARLPFHDTPALQGNWQLRVLADGVLIAVHDFGWQESTSSVLRKQLQEDGELIGEARAMLAANRLQHMSLDELLADQQPDDDSGSEEARKEQASHR